MSGPVLLFGGSGLLGESLRNELAARGRAFLAPGRSSLDLLDAESIARRIDRERCSALINAAAYTDVTRAELPAERATVHRVNRDAPAALARICAERALPLICVSTDFVFDGQSTRPYRETDEPAPLQVYGRSKLEGERAVLGAWPGALVVRSSTLFGPARRGRLHYVDAILDQIRHGLPIRVVRTPISSPTYTPDLARALVDLLDAGAQGLIHVVNAGSCSRLELARATVGLAREPGNPPVEERDEPAEGPRRPAYSVLDAGRFAAVTGASMRDWREALADYVARGGR